MKHLSDIQVIKSAPIGLVATVVEQSSSARLGLPLLLVVEDDKLLALQIANDVSDQYRVEFAVNGQIGFEKALKMVPDIVICDLRMPEMDGFEFCRALRANQYISHIPVVILTAFTDESSRIEALKAGANALLIKPVSPETLRPQLESLLRLCQEMRRLWQDHSAISMVETIPSIQMEKVFLEKMMALIASRSDDPAFSVADLQRALNFSKSQLHRKLISLTGYPASHFIRQHRLNEARKLLLANPHLSVAEVAYQVGYSDPNYFSRAFSVFSGKSPSKYRK